MCAAWFWQQFGQSGKSETSVFVALESSGKDFCFVDGNRKQNIQPVAVQENAWMWIRISYSYIFKCDCPHLICVVLPCSFKTKSIRERNNEVVNRRQIMSFLVFACNCRIKRSCASSLGTNWRFLLYMFQSELGSFSLMLELKHSKKCFATGFIRNIKFHAK